MENKNMKSNAFYMSMNSCFWKKKTFSNVSVTPWQSNVIEAEKSR
jgi:hypothetical protein